MRSRQARLGRSIGERAGPRHGKDAAGGPPRFSQSVFSGVCHAQLSGVGAPYRYHIRLCGGPHDAGATGLSNLYPSRIDSLFFGVGICSFSGDSARIFEAPLLPPSPTLLPDRKVEYFCPFD